METLLILIIFLLIANLLTKIILYKEFKLHHRFIQNAINNIKTSSDLDYIDKKFLIYKKYIDEKFLIYYNYNK